METFPSSLVRERVGFSSAAMAPESHPYRRHSLRMFIPIGVNKISSLSASMATEFHPFRCQWLQIFLPIGVNDLSVDQSCFSHTYISKQVRLSRATLEFQVFQVPTGLKVFKSQVISQLDLSRLNLSQLALS